MRRIILLLFISSIASVHGFYYQLLPLVVLDVQEGNKKVKKVFCPWNMIRQSNLTCKQIDRAYSYYDKGNHPNAKNYQLLNLTLQKWFSTNPCDALRKAWNSKKNLANSCKAYSLCFNATHDQHICTCQAGFFGDPYAGCKQHCLKDEDCGNPLAVCVDSWNTGELKRCACKAGYDGDGVFCKKNPCGADRLTKCTGGRLCVPMGPGENDYKCMCPEGQFLDNAGNCIDLYTLRANTVLTLVGKNIKDGSRVEAGDCLSFTLNDGHKSIFFHKNSGDSIYVKKTIKNENQFTLFFILTNEITVYSSLKEGPFGLSKLYSMSNTFLGCKFGNVKVFDPLGRDVSEQEEETETKVEQKTTEGQGTKTTAPPKKPEVPPAKAQDSSPGGKVEPPPKPKEPKPTVEVHIRDLTVEELSGGLAAALAVPPTLLELANSSTKAENAVTSSTTSQEVSHLQRDVSTGSKGEL